MNAPATVAALGRQALRDQFANNLRLWRHQRGLSQADLASVSGMNRCFLSRVERGHCSISLETLELLASALHVEPSMLIVPMSLTPPPPQPLRSWRERKGLNQSELAEASGVSRFTINKIENGKLSPGLKTGNALSCALGVPAFLIM